MIKSDSKNCRIAFIVLHLVMLWKVQMVMAQTIGIPHHIIYSP